MKILVATFDHTYYLWQVLVQINNFIKYGYDEDTIYVVSTSNPSPVLLSLMNHPKIKSKFFIYKDERQNSRYPSSLRPHILEKFFTENPEYNDETDSFGWLKKNEVLNFKKWLKASKKKPKGIAV